MRVRPALSPGMSSSAAVPSALFDCCRTPGTTKYQALQCLCDAASIVVACGRPPIIAQRCYANKVPNTGAGGRPACDKCGGGDCRDDDDRAKSCIRYHREEAKIQAWINQESAKPEAQSRKLQGSKARGQVPMLGVESCGCPCF